MIQLERCRSHEVHSSPQTWEYYRRFSTPAELLAYIEEYPVLPPRNASGDQFRVLVGEESFGVMDYLRSLEQ